MSDWVYTEEELNRYFNDPVSRRRGANNSGGNSGKGKKTPRRGILGRIRKRLGQPEKIQAFHVFAVLASFLTVLTFALGIYLLTLSDDLPSFEQLDNPYLRFATVAYTSDGEELAIYGSQNRMWVSYDEISPHVINAVIASEDHRFYDHWGMDLFRTFSAIGHTLLGDTQGGSTLSQQLARNLYNEQIGREQTIGRKLKEMVTAVQLERRYTKQEIIEMYLNTVEFGQNAFGIEAAAQTFFGKPADDLDVKESATLVGILRAISFYNPVRHPDRARWVRNVVMRQMVKYGFISPAYFEEHRENELGLDPRSNSPRAGIAPFFAEYVNRWLIEWAEATEHDINSEGLVVYTTLDSRLQELANLAVQEQMEGLQAVVDFEWSRAEGYGLGQDLERYKAQKGYVPFDYFWKTRRATVTNFIQETVRFKDLRDSGLGTYAAIELLLGDKAFMDSLRTVKTGLETGLVAIDPGNGQVKAWVGGHNAREEWFDHVATARRQPGSAFKPFLYTAAIDNGYEPDYLLPDSTFIYRDPVTGQVWAPQNFGGEMGGMLTLREAIARSSNVVAARVITQLVNPVEVARYAYRMGIKSYLNPVPSLALGTSEVTLLEMTTAYGTLANGGLYYEPEIITRIEDRFGNVLYEAPSIPESEALSPETAYTVVDMLRGVVDHGTAVRLKSQFMLGDFDLAAKTGTTQEGADGWLMLMHPQLVTGVWVGFNDPRVTFRSDSWGQGGRNALIIAGAFFRSAVEADINFISDERFPNPPTSGEERDGWVGW